MSLDNKVEVETEIINRYLNKEINLLEKEMALNVIFACNNHSFENEMDNEDIEIGFFKNVLSGIPSKALVDLLIAYGRENYNSDKLNPQEIEQMTLAALEQREIMSNKYENTLTN